MKKLTIEFDGAWVLQHRDDDELPIAILKNELSKLSGVQEKDSSLTSLTLVFDEQKADTGDITELIKKLIADRYPQDKSDDILSVEIVDVPEEKDVNQTSDDPSSGETEGKPQSGSDSQSGQPKEDGLKTDNKTAGVLQKIDALVGALEFKRLAHEIADIADEVKRTNTQEVFTNWCYLFSIGDGCGLTTYLDSLAELISSVGLGGKSAGVREESLAPYRESLEPFEEVMRTLNVGNSKSLRVLCVDISEWMNHTDNHYFKQFLRAVEKHANEFIVVFRIPFVDKDVLAKIRYSLSDLLSVKTVSFPPLNHDEIQACAVSEFDRFGFSVVKGAWKFIFERIAEEKSDGKFYGINTVKKVVRELVYQKHLSNINKTHKSSQITINDAKAVTGNANSSNLSGMEQLDKLVGIESVKKRVEEIIAQIEMSIQDGSAQRPCIHMRFVGNPGTGKTTVARIIGRILKDKGVLRVGAFFEYGGRDFCGRYVGETAPKTTSICRDAYGSVLFIDEAYSLYRADDDSRDFGREAIDTLIAEMENHRNDLVVIMAGYVDDMNKLMKGNLGLASRMPYTIEFPNFTREQLYEIFKSMVNEKFKCDSGLLDAARKFFDGLPDETLSSKEFSNARYVRNLFERTWAKAAMRCQLSGSANVTLTREDFEQASADKDFISTMPKKARIGFNI
ncbi:MAG: AAA family ATPase [Clostridiales bacterium]|nr:AAA family ATPase [Clostridiales bacterium]